MTPLLDHISTNPGAQTAFIFAVGAVLIVAIIIIHVRTMR